jgi:hypothetical protein
MCGGFLSRRGGLETRPLEFVHLAPDFPRNSAHQLARRSG